MEQLNVNTYYWVKTNGYLTEYTAIYRNSNGKWRLNIDDKTLFVSDYKLSLLYGKGCVVREFDESRDLLKIDENNILEEKWIKTEESVKRLISILKSMKESRQVQMMLKSENGNSLIVNYYPMFRSYDVNYGFIKLKEEENMLRDYGLVFFNK